MTDLHAQLRAAIQQVRTSEPHDATCGSKSCARCGFLLTAHPTRKSCAPPVPYPCTCDWAARVDARLAACVEAAITCAYLSGDDSPPSAHHRAVAAFVARAAQKENV